MVRNIWTWLWPVSNLAIWRMADRRNHWMWNAWSVTLAKWWLFKLVVVKSNRPGSLSLGSSYGRSWVKPLTRPIETWRQEVTEPPETIGKYKICQNWKENGWVSCCGCGRVAILSFYFRIMHSGKQASCGALYSVVIEWNITDTMMRSLEFA